MLTPFTLAAEAGATALTIAGRPVDGVMSAVIQTGGPDTVPVLTVQYASTGTIEGEGIVQVVRDPTPQEINAAALDVLSRVDPAELEARCETKIRAGRRDPYRVALEVLTEMARA